jgi:hypothetical protein
MAAQKAVKGSMQLRAEQADGEGDHRPVGERHGSCPFRMMEDLLLYHASVPADLSFAAHQAREPVTLMDAQVIVFDPKRQQL